MEERKAEKKLNRRGTYSKTYEMVYTAVFVVLITMCAWITIPFGIVPVTMQTFAVFLTMGLLGGRRGTMAIFIYLLMGCIGLPVFSGFQAGVGVLLGQTGGYLIGFLLIGASMWVFENLGKKNRYWQLAGMIVGQLLCYSFGTVWYMVMYMNSVEIVSLGTVLGVCVVPFIIPDIIKIGLAHLLTKRLLRIMNV